MSRHLSYDDIYLTISFWATELATRYALTLTTTTTTTSLENCAFFEYLSIFCLEEKQHVKTSKEEYFLVSISFTNFANACFEQIDDINTLRTDGRHIS